MKLLEVLLELMVFVIDEVVSLHFAIYQVTIYGENFHEDVKML